MDKLSNILITLENDDVREILEELEQHELIDEYSLRLIIKLARYVYEHVECPEQVVEFGGPSQFFKPLIDELDIWVENICISQR